MAQAGATFASQVDRTDWAFAPGEDFGRAVARLSWLGGDVGVEFLRTWNQVERILSANWQCVMELADMLVKAGELGASTVLPWWEAHPKAVRGAVKATSFRKP